MIRNIAQYMHVRKKYNAGIIDESEAMRSISVEISDSINSCRRSSSLIADSLEALSTVGQDNSSASEELAASAEEIAGIADSMKKLTENF